MKLYVKPSHMRPDEYAAFTDPANHTAQLLLAHTFLLDYILGDYIFRHEQQLGKVARKRVILSWISSIAEKLPPDYRSYMAWPLSYAQELFGSYPTRGFISAFATRETSLPTATSIPNFGSDLPVISLPDAALGCNRFS
jgi:hypothetical protein